jgi:hypothetical protein
MTDSSFLGGVPCSLALTHTCAHVRAHIHTLIKYRPIYEMSLFECPGLLCDIERTLYVGDWKSKYTFERLEIYMTLRYFVW